MRGRDSGRADAEAGGAISRRGELPERREERETENRIEGSEPEGGKGLASG